MTRNYFLYFSIFMCAVYLGLGYVLLLTHGLWTLLHDKNRYIVGWLMLALGIFRAITLFRKLRN